MVNDLRGERADSVVEEVLAAGGTARGLPFDVTEYQAVADALAAGAIDVLLNAGNAGADGFLTAHQSLQHFQGDSERFHWTSAVVTNRPRSKIRSQGHENGPRSNLRGPFPFSSGDRIRTCDLWVMSRSVAESRG